MLNLIKSRGRRFNCTLYVLPIILGLAVVASYLNPQPIEAPHQIVLDLSSQKQFCELHGTALQMDEIHAECAERVSLNQVEQVKLNRPDPFPNAYEECPSGCTGFEDKWAKVTYCPKCRRGQRWADYQRILKFKWRKLFS